MTVQVVENPSTINAQTAKFFVSAEGEIFRNGSMVDQCSSMDMKELALKKGFDWNVVSQYRQRNEETQSWFQTMDDQWDQLYQENLTVKEYNFVKKTLEYQVLVGFERFRVMGQIDQNNNESIVIVTEFKQLVEIDQFWNDVNKVKNDLNANLWIMAEDPYYDYGWADDEEVGPNHGKLERQIELSWPVESKSIQEFKDFLKFLEDETQNLWQSSAVPFI